jgi:GNAT superfamily N-acetyltransferase
MKTELNISQISNSEIAVDHLGITSRVEIAQSLSQLEEARALDDLAFGIHQGITMDELIKIKNHGAVLLLRDAGGALIGESQVITSPISQHSHLAPDEAYNYGTAIHPELQNHGLAQILFKAQEAVAIAAGKTRGTLTARLENAQSLRGRFKAGFQIVGYDPNCYGTFESGGARLFLEKDLTNGTEVVSLEALLQNVAGNEVRLLNRNNINEVLQSEPPMIGFTVINGDGIDHDAHQFIGKIFESKRYLGVGLLKSSELYSGKSQYSLLILKHK